LIIAATFSIPHWSSSVEFEITGYYDSVGFGVQVAMTLIHHVYDYYNRFTAHGMCPGLPG